MVFDTTALAEQSRIRDHWSIDEGRYLTDYLDEQKFAQAIVQECINACESHDIESFGILPIRAVMVTKSCQNNIKEHFGVDK